MKKTRMNLSSIARRLFCAIVLVGCVVFAGCGGDNKSSAPEADKASGAVKPVSSAGKAADKEAPKNILKARAKIAPAKEGFPSDFDFSIEVFESGAVSGSAAVGDNTLVLSGELLDGTLRLWAKGDEKASLKGGFFIADLVNDKAEGNFAASGNGGAPSIRGTWKTI